eukprot:798564-Rhodomonas_salina.1
MEYCASRFRIYKARRVLSFDTPPSTHVYESSIYRHEASFAMEFGSETRGREQAPAGEGDRIPFHERVAQRRAAHACAAKCHRERPLGEQYRRYDATRVDCPRGVRVEE